MRFSSESVKSRDHAKKLKYRNRQNMSRSDFDDAIEARHQYEKSRKRDLLNYLASIGQGFSSTIDRLSYLIGDSHDLSVGRYKERVLMKTISEFIPKNYSVGSGFVIFPTYESDRSSSDKFNSHQHQISREIDIIVYDSSNYSTVFQDQDFVIVRPESVRSIIEVKSALNEKQASSFLDSFIDFGRKWFSTSQLYGKSSGLPNLKIPGLFAMNWSISLDKKGRKMYSAQKLANKIVSKYKSNVESFIEVEDFPLLHTALIYRDSIITNVYRVPEVKSDYLDFGYLTLKGRFEQSSQAGKLDAGDDKTVAQLLFWIDHFLRSSYTHNPFFTKPDIYQSCDYSQGYFAKLYDEPFH